MSLAYVSGDHTIATAVGLPEFEAPFPGVNTDYILTQLFQQTESDFVPLALNTAHPTFPLFLLALEGPKEDVSGNRVQWTRTYAKKPAQRIEFSTFVYTFIGFYGVFGNGNGNVTGRDTLTRVVPCKIVFDYFLIAASGGDYTSADEIPINEAQKYYDGTENQQTLFLTNSPPFTPATTPSRAVYEAMIADDDYNIVVEDSTIERWMGNIYVRTTKYVKAQ